MWRGSLADAGDHLAAVPPRGEYVLVVAGAPEAPPAGEDDIEEALRAYLAAGADRKTAVAEVARELGVSKRLVYAVVLRLNP